MRRPPPTPIAAALLAGALASLAFAAPPTSELSLGGRGAPWLLLEDARAAAAAASPLGARALAGEPRALAAGDLDRDGMPDLAVGLATSAGGRVVIYPGNLDHLFPNAPAATARRAAGFGVDEPFLAATAALELDRAPDFLAIGDFDADGAADLVAAALGADSLDFAPGDGRGGFRAPRRLDLDGALTAFAAGEIDQRDLLPDLALALVDGEGRAEIALLAGAQGAANARVERLPVRSPATALLLAPLDGDTHHDLALASAAGIELVFGRGGVPGAAVEARDRSAQHARLPFVARALAAGEFTGGGHGPGRELAFVDSTGALRIVRVDRSADGRVTPNESAHLPEVAGPGPVGLVPAHLNAAGLEQLVTFGGGTPPRITQPDLPPRQRGAGRERLELDGERAPVAALALRLNADALADLVVLVEGSAEPRVLLSRGAATYTVDTPGATSDCNTNDSVCATDAGTGCGSGGCTLAAAIQQANASSGADTIAFAVGAEGVHVALPSSYGINEALTVDGTTEPGYAGEPLVHLDGPYCNTAVLGIDSANVVVRGVGVHGCTGISFGNSASNSYFEGNRSGPFAPLSLSAPGTDVAVSGGATAITIGGAAAAAGNRFWGENSSYHDVRGSGQTVRGNVYGLDPEGAFAPPNADLVLFYAASNATVIDNVIAGTDLWERNALLVLGGSGSVYQGNWVGTDASGNAAVGHTGPCVVTAYGAGHVSNLTFGGSAPGQGNVLAGCSRYGLNLSTAATGNVVRGNLVGIGADGTTALGNGWAGIRVGFDTTTGITVGGTGAGEGNVIANNGGAGVLVQDGWNHRIRGNSIFDNAGIGIDLTSQGNNAGVSANDLGDADGGDWSGHGNQYQNFPVLAAAGGTTVAGGLDSASSTTYDLDFYASPSCDGSGHGEAKVYLGTIQVTTNASGSTSFVAAVGALADGDFVAATATDPNGNTSELSACFAADASLIFADGFGSGTTSVWSAKVP